MFRQKFLLLFLKPLQLPTPPPPPVTTDDYLFSDGSNYLFNDSTPYDFSEAEE